MRRRSGYLSLPRNCRLLRTHSAVAIQENLRTARHVHSGKQREEVMSLVKHRPRRPLPLLPRVRLRLLELGEVHPRVTVGHNRQRANDRLVRERLPCLSPRHRAGQGVCNRVPSIMEHVVSDSLMKMEVLSRHPSRPQHPVAVPDRRVRRRRSPRTAPIYK